MAQMMVRPLPGGISIKALPFSAKDGAVTRLHNLLTVPEQEALSRISEVVAFARGGVPVFWEGDDAEFLYALSSGVVRICRHDQQGERQILSFLFAGDLFGLAEEGHYVNSAETVTKVVAYRLPVERLKNLMLRQPLLQLHLLTKAAHELRAAQRQIIILGQRQADRRLACFLADLCQNHALFNESERTLRLPVRRYDIADYLGASTESISRAFGRLERAGLIRRRSPSLVEIPSVAGLARYGQGLDQAG